MSPTRPFAAVADRERVRVVVAEVDHEEQRDVERWAAIGAARRAPAAGENAGAPALHVYNFCHELLEVAVEPLVVGGAKQMGWKRGE